MTFWWWDDAVNVAARRALVSGRRHRVRSWFDGWLVEEVGA